MKTILKTLCAVVAFSVQSLFASTISSPSMTFVEAAGTVDFSSAIDWMIFGNTGTTLYEKDDTNFNIYPSGADRLATSSPFNFKLDDSADLIGGSIGFTSTREQTLQYLNAGLGESGTLRIYVTLPETSLVTFNLDYSGNYEYTTTVADAGMSGYLDIEYVNSSDTSRTTLLNITSALSNDGITIYAIATMVPEPTAISLIALAGILTLTTKRIFCT